MTWRRAAAVYSGATLGQRQTFDMAPATWRPLGGRHVEVIPGGPGPTGTIATPTTLAKGNDLGKFSGAVTGAVRADQKFGAPQPISRLVIAESPRGEVTVRVMMPGNWPKCVQFTVAFGFEPPPLTSSSPTGMAQV